MRIAGLGGLEWLIIVLVVVLIFGAGKIADLGPALGRSIRGFRNALKGEEKDSSSTKLASQEKPADSNANVKG